VLVLPVRGLGSTYSGRSILVAPTASPARRVKVSTSSTVIPVTCDCPPLTSGIQVPVPLNAPSLGSLPVPSISAADVYPSLATYSVPDSSSVMLCRRAFVVRPASNRLSDTNLYR
jgi:hypothetical protein